jgi:hypothetical protein
MELRTLKQLFFVVISVTLFAGCTASTQIAQGIADNAPFAKPPQIVKVGGRQWDGDPVYYNSGGAFEFIVKHGLANELIVKENNIALSRVFGPPLPGTPNAVYWRVGSIADDAVAQTTTAQLRVFTKESEALGPFAPPPDGTERVYSFFEQSINPRATGKDQQSDPTEVKLVVWGRKPVIAVFNTSPQNPATNVPLVIDWRANDCKKVELLERLSFTKPDGSTEERESVIESKVFNPGPAGSLDGSRTLTVGLNTTAIVLRVYGAGGDVITDTKEVSVSGPVACPQNPNGRKNWYQFCLECTGQPLTGISERGCTEDEALAQSIKSFKSEFCEVRNRACYAP